MIDFLPPHVYSAPFNLIAMKLVTMLSENSEYGHLAKPLEAQMYRKIMKSLENVI